MSSDFPVNGLKELDKFLSALPQTMQKAAYRQALTAAAKPVRDEARLRAPKKTGKMARAIKTGSPRQNPDGTFSISIRLDGEHSFLGLFHEYGVAPHLIARTGALEGRVAVKMASTGDYKGVTQRRLKKKGQTGLHLKAMKIGNDFVSGIISRPGHAAHSFMRPALDAKADEAIKAFAGKIRDFIEGKTGFAAPVDEAA